MTLTTHDSQTIYFETYGKPGHPAVLLLHGLGADLRMFSHQVKAYTDAGFFVIIPDLRGHGNSSPVDSIELSDWVLDLLELIDSLDIPKVSVIGVSMGGVIALELAAGYQERLEALIVCDSFGEISSPAEYLISHGQVLGFRLFDLFPPRTAASLIASAYRGISREAQQYFKEIAEKSNFRRLARVRRAINKVNILRRLSGISLPVLVMAGSRVKVVVKAGEKIARSIPGAEFSVLPGSLDPSNLVAPDEFNRITAAFLVKHQNSRSSS